MFGEVCSNFTYNFHWDNSNDYNFTANFTEFDHELECIVSRTVFILFSFIGIAGLVGNILVVLGKLQMSICSYWYGYIKHHQAILQRAIGYWKVGYIFRNLIQIHKTYFFFDNLSLFAHKTSKLIRKTFGKFRNVVAYRNI